MTVSFVFLGIMTWCMTDIETNLVNVILTDNWEIAYCNDIDNHYSAIAFLGWDGLVQLALLCIYLNHICKYVWFEKKKYGMVILQSLSVFISMVTSWLLLLHIYDESNPMMRRFRSYAMMDPTINCWCMYAIMWLYHCQSKNGNDDDITGTDGNETKTIDEGTRDVFHSNMHSHRESNEQDTEMILCHV